MRKIATVKKSATNAVRLMICDNGKEGVYVFGYHTKEDAPAAWDYHFSDLEDAYEMGIDYGIQKEDWQEIAAPQKYCQDDWINPVRIIGRSTGNPQWGKFEKLVDNQWIRID